MSKKVDFILFFLFKRLVFVLHAFNFHQLYDIVFVFIFETFVLLLKCCDLLF